MCVGATFFIVFREGELPDCTEEGGLQLTVSVGERD